MTAQTATTSTSAPEKTSNFNHSPTRHTKYPTKINLTQFSIVFSFHSIDVNSNALTPSEAINVNVSQVSASTRMINASTLMSVEL